MQDEKVIDLETKLPAYMGDTCIGAYTAQIGKNIAGTVIVRITPCEGTAGYWTYYLETLLHLDQWGATRPSDVLYIDLGQKWSVRNMRKLYREIINNYISI